MPQNKELAKLAAASYEALKSAQASLLLAANTVALEGRANDAASLKNMADDVYDLNMKDSGPNSRDDWQYEVANGDTMLGYDAWVTNREELAELDEAKRRRTFGWPRKKS
jgi:hypothetical protein